MNKFISIVDAEAIRDLPFRGRMLPKDCSPQVIDLWRGLVLHEFNYRQLILAAPPASEERSRLTRELYAGTYQLFETIKQIDSRWHSSQDHTDKSHSARALTRLGTPGRCIEIGCGGGMLCRALGQLGWDVHGIDVVASTNWTTIATESRGKVKFEVREFTLQGLPDSQPFDLAVLDNCLEHIPPGDYERTLCESFRILAPGGWVVIAIPNPLTGPHDCSIEFAKRGSPAFGSHFSERTVLHLSSDLYRAGFRGFRSVMHGGMWAGARWGWSWLWFCKALVCEQLFRLFPTDYWSDETFEFWVPYAIAAQKPKQHHAT